jgi:hypothetical protein
MWDGNHWWTGCNMIMAQQLTNHLTSTLQWHAGRLLHTTADIESQAVSEFVAVSEHRGYTPGYAHTHVRGRVAGCLISCNPATLGSLLGGFRVLCACNWSTLSIAVLCLVRAVAIVCSWNLQPAT